MLIHFHLSLNQNHLEVNLLMQLDYFGFFVKFLISKPIIIDTTALFTNMFIHFFIVLSNCVLLSIDYDDFCLVHCCLQNHFGNGILLNDSILVDLQ